MQAGLFFYKMMQASRSFLQGPMRGLRVCDDKAVGVVLFPGLKGELKLFACSPRLGVSSA